MVSGWSWGIHEIFVFGTLCMIISRTGKTGQEPGIVDRPEAGDLK